MTWIEQHPLTVLYLVCTGILLVAFTVLGVR